MPGTSVKAYVLGPPRDIAAIRKMNPSGDQGYRHIANYSFGEAIDREGDAGVDDSLFD